ncbi:DUF1674 domain containing protein [Trichuris trichiura]|uniref:Succinate dehydrogenase assembly factor 4, mitochondrial n=1 Tax=Trichuris trichiura TaxID=36087 RepID=A0A077Z960_TRITR|nr:DUF1674 domain containing protein [Trichuris trichiura]
MQKAGRITFGSFRCAGQIICRKEQFGDFGKSAPVDGTSAPNVDENSKAREETGSENVENANQHKRQALQKWPNNVNPLTGEIGGPAGPEPTRYSDWERKGRVTDF